MQNEQVIERKVTAKDIMFSFYETDNTLKHAFCFIHEDDKQLEFVLYNVNTQETDDSHFFSFPDQDLQQARFKFIQEMKIAMLSQGAILK
jgi:hypothetical protein